MRKIQKKVESLSRKCIQINVDLAKRESIDKIVQITLERYGKIDILVNNAGVIRRSNFIEFSEQDWQDVIKVNQTSLFLLSQAVAKVMIEKSNGGKIINVPSILSYQGGVLVPSYTASKTAVLGLTRLMANELAKYKINVNAIAPGYMKTEITAPLRHDQVRNKEILERIPAGRWGEPNDLKGVVVFLASEASSYLHGFTIAVDGGWLAR